MASRLIPVAEVTRPHGVRGELRLHVYNEGSDLLLSRPRIVLRLQDGAERDGRIVAARPANKALLVRLAGVDDRDAAEALRGASVCVGRDTFPPLEEGEFYQCDLEGAQVVLRGGGVVGRVQRLQPYPTCDALVVEREGAAPLEVPLTDDFVAAVDVERQTVELHTLEGLD